MALGISDKSPEYDLRIPEWEQVRRAIEGERRVKDARTLDLPKPLGQDPEHYREYLQRAGVLRSRSWSTKS